MHGAAAVFTSTVNTCQSLQIQKLIFWFDLSFWLSAGQFFYKFARNSSGNNVFFVGPQGQYLMWFTGPYRFLLASGQRASVSVEPWTHVKLQHFKGLIYNFRPDFKNSPMLGRHTSEKVILQFFSLFLHDYVNCETLYKYFCSTTTSIVRFTLNSSTRIIEFRGFLIQFL